MPSDDKQLPRKVSQTEWLAARQAMSKKEENFAIAREALVAKWREMPILEIETNYVFEGPNGGVNLLDLFDGRSQLLVYHFWFQPGEEPCEGCSLWTNDLGDLGGDFASLHGHDTSLAFVSRASAPEIADVKKRRGWTMPWVAMVNDDFDDVTGYDGWAQISVFIFADKNLYLSNVVSFDDLKAIGNHWTLLERTPFGVRS